MVDEVTEDTHSRGRTMPAFQTPRIVSRMILNAGAAYSAGSSNGSAPNSGKQQRKRNKSKKLKAGPLMQRLRTLRSAVDGDCVRFQSGMYPFAQSASKRYDLTDPRNRATSYMDVSIVAEPVTWNNNDRVTVLGFVHAHVKSKSLAKAADVDTRGFRNAWFAWLSFTFDTAREQKLRQGSQLRIYNAIIVPSKESVQIDGLKISLPEEDRCCAQTVLCTQLCEPYPDSLPPLPSVMETNSGADP